MKISQQKTTTKPKSTTKSKKKVTKKKIKEEVYNSLSPRNIFYAVIAGIMLAIIIIICNKCEGPDEKKEC